jgi:phosphatidylglycerophosphate synthase
MLQSIPAALVVLRFLIAPYLLWDALDGETGTWFVVAYVVAVLSDILDGVIARRLGVSTAELRQADSWADVCLYICVAASVWLVHPDVAIAFRIPLLSVVLAQLLWLAVNLVKYGKPASYHTYSAKLWGVTLCAATVALFGFNTAGIALWLAIGVGILHSLEEILMTLILPQWTHDVLSLVHALRLRQTLMNPSLDPAPVSTASEPS